MGHGERSGGGLGPHLELSQDLATRSPCEVTAQSGLASGLLGLLSTRTWGQRPCEPLDGGMACVNAQTANLAHINAQTGPIGRTSRPTGGGSGGSRCSRGSSVHPISPGNTRRPTAPRQGKSAARCARCCPSSRALGSSALISCFVAEPRGDGRDNGAALDGLYLVQWDNARSLTARIHELRSWILFSQRVVI